MSERIQKIVDLRTGIIKQVYDSSTFSYPIHIHAKVAEKNTLSTTEGEIVIPTGYGGLGYSITSKEEAGVKAIGEAIERYCALYFNQDLIVEGSYNDLVHLNRLDPLTVTSYDDWQYELPNFSYSKINHNTMFSWINGTDVLNQTNIWIPSCLVHLYGKYKNLIRDRLSTGLAAGSSERQAFEGGLLECIERDAIMIMWLNELSMPIIKNDSIDDPIIQRTLKLCQRLNLEVIIVDISTDVLIPTYFVIILNNEGVPYVSVGASSHYHYKKALRSAVEEASIVFNHSYNSYLDGTLSDKDFSDLNTVSVEDHSSYYARGHGRNNIEFLFKGEKISLEKSLENKINSFDSLMSKLKELELNVYSVDLTTEDIKHLDLFVQRVIVPEFAFLESTYPMLRCKRLTEVPHKMGYKTKNSFNKNPHPFP